MLWDMTWNIIAMEGVDADMYKGTGGNNISLQLVMDGLKLQPCNPGFVDGRDAILLADEINYNGKYHCAIWNAFAKRGLGVSADQGSSSSHTDGTEAFDVPDGIRVIDLPPTDLALEGEELTFAVRAICECEDKTNVSIKTTISEDLTYITGSGGQFDGDSVKFFTASLLAEDTMEFSFKAYVNPCSASDAALTFTDNVEGADKFSSIKLAGNGNKKWNKNTTQFVSPGTSWYAQDYNTLTDVALTTNAPIMVSGPIKISFNHQYETEATYDGGIMEFSLDGGTTWVDAGDYFIENGYPSSITTSNTNSLIAGQPAFTGDSDIQFDTIGFIRSTIELCTATNQSLLFRFRFVADGSVGGSGINGWYIDDILVTQLSGITNKLEVIVDSVMIDSIFTCIETTKTEGNILYVDDSSTGKLNGSSWAEAMHSLPIALQVAGCRSPDSIFVAEGSYLPNFLDDRELAFSIPDSISVFGGFSSGGSDFGSRDPSIFSTILSGDIGIEADSSDNVYHVLKINPGQKEILLDGVIIGGGYADGIGDNSMGAAIFSEGTFKLKNSTLLGNNGSSDGQLILNRGADAILSIQDCNLSILPGPIINILNLNSGQLFFFGENQFHKE
jgi:hypothetical protein